MMLMTDQINKYGHTGHNTLDDGCNQADIVNLENRLSNWLEILDLSSTHHLVRVVKERAPLFLKVTHPPSTKASHPQKPPRNYRPDRLPPSSQQGVCHV